MKKLILATLLGIISIGSMNAKETREVYENGHAVMGFVISPEIKWEVALKNDSGYKSCLLTVVNQALICTYFNEPLKEAKELWDIGIAEPKAQSFQYDSSTPHIWAYKPYIGELGNGEYGYMFLYNERIKIDGTTYDQIRVNTCPNFAELGSVYFLDKFK